MHRNDKTTVSLPRDFAVASAGDGKRRPVFVVLDGPNLHRRYDITKSDMTLGRDDCCDICLGDTACSRCHAKVSYSETKTRSGKLEISEVTLADLKSTNGTFVNGARIETVTLKNGDRVLLGKTLLGFYEWDESVLQFEEALHKAAAIDSVTCLFNRNYFSDAMRQVFQRTRRYGKTFALIILSVDRFRELAEAHGAEAAEKILREVANRVTLVSRKNDVPCRYAGEEIAILLPDLDLDGARSQAEQLCEVLRQEVLSIGDLKLEVTASVGVAELRPWMKEADEVLEAADNALCLARHQGGDRVLADSEFASDSDATVQLRDG